MDSHVLNRIWRDVGACFIPTIEGWTKDPKSGKYKALRYREGKAYSKDIALDQIRKHKPLDSHRDCYFCPVQFTSWARETHYAIPELNVLWADLDEADPNTMHPRPTIAWKSSKTHYQALWILTEFLPTKELEALNKALTYHVGADKSGWDLTQLLRVPGSWNFKRDSEHPDYCELLWDDGMTWSVDRLREIVKSTESIAEYSLDGSIDGLIEGWKLNSRTRMLLYATEAPLGERSDRLWELEKLLVEAGMPVSLIVDIIKLTVWNKFSGRKDGDKQLLAETLKAEREFRLGKVITIVETDTIRKESLLTFDGFMEQDIPAPEYMVEGFLQSSSVGICAGEPKTMKSTLMLDMAVSVASGKPFLGLYKVQPNPVLYIQEENGEPDIKRRFMRIAYNRRVLVNTSMGFEPMPIPLYIMNNKGINLQTEEDRVFINKSIEEEGIKLLILDPWYMMCGELNENDAGEVGKILKYLTTLRNNYGCTVMLVHHFKKGEASRGGQRMRGSSVFHSWIECGLYSEINKGKEGNIIMEREFRAFPTTKGLNIIFSTEDSPLAYDVQVHDVSDSYLAKLRASKSEEVKETVSDSDGVDLMDLIEGKDLKDKELTIPVLLEIITLGRFSPSKLMIDYGVSKSKLDEMIRRMITTGHIVRDGKSIRVTGKR